MLAMRCSPDDVVKTMEGNPFVIEPKFDGERIQVHKNGKEVRIYSRNSNEVTALVCTLRAFINFKVWRSVDSYYTESCTSVTYHS
jgi:ATP-dependent DNA ligase